MQTSALRLLLGAKPLDCLCLQVHDDALPTERQEKIGRRRTGILYIDPTSDALLNLEPVPDPDYLAPVADRLWEVCSQALLCDQRR